MSEEHDHDHDLTVRLAALREAMEEKVNAIRELVTIRQDGQDQARQILLDGLRHDTGQLQIQIDRRFADLDGKLTERFQTQSKSIEVAFAAADKAVRAALDAAEKAVNKAEVATEKRFESVNEFRLSLSDQTAGFMTRDEVGVRVQGLQDGYQRTVEQISALELRLTSRLDTFRGSAEGTREYKQETLGNATFEQFERVSKAQSTRAVIATAIAGVSTLVAIVSVFLVVLGK